MRAVHYALFSILVASTSVPAAANDEDVWKPEEGPWRIVLKTQLRNEQSCDLNEVLAYQEIPLGTDVGLDGHISCIDGREFNFTRKGKNQKFSIDLCKPAVC